MVINKFDYDNRKIKISNYQKEWFKKNKERLAIKKKEYYKINKKKLFKKHKEWKEKNKEYIKTYNKSYKSENKELVKKINKNYKTKFHNKLMKYHVAYYIKRKKYDIDFKLKHNTSRYINNILNSRKYRIHCEDLLGYTIKELKQHLESKFVDGMSWDNYGLKGWHIDHIIPLNRFNIISYDCEDFKKAWALDNLQPLWAKDNLKKSNKTMEEYLKGGV